MQIESIIKEFALDGKVAEIKPMTAGHINTTYRVTMEDGARYVIQNINVNVFKDPDGLMDNIFSVCDYLKTKLEPGADPLRATMTFIRTKDGHKYFLDEETGKYWRMYIFIKAASYNKIEKPGLFFNAAEEFGHFQCQLSDYPAATLCETIPNFHNTVSRFADFKAAVEGCKLPERLEEAKSEIAEMLAHESLAHIAIDAIADGKLPLRVTHNDTKLNNILMDEETDKGLCVIDLDTVMPGSVLYDFGDAIRFGANTAVEDEPELSKVSLDTALFEEFARGFIKGTNGALTDLELELLPEGAMLLTFEQSIRFLGDYLNGDTYFHIEYPEHNLVRARVQIELLADMERKFPEMKRIIADIRKNG